MEKDLVYKELQSIKEMCFDLKVLQAENNKELQYHIRRSDLLEKRVDQVDRDITKVRGFVSIGGWIIGTVAIITNVIYHLTKM